MTKYAEIIVDLSSEQVDRLFTYRVPEGMTLGEAMSEKFLHEAGVFITPGFIFGKNGRNFVRISLCAPVPVLADAERKIKAAI